tara:strand:- start:56 stop:280 length:225 start_codon:yes stop_codon:yes gene_type:complete
MYNLEEHEVDEWSIVYLGNTDYELNIFSNEHGELCVTVYPIKLNSKGDAEVDVLNPVASGKLDIFSLKRIKENL